MSFFKCLCLCFSVMMFLGAVKANCVDSRCCICNKESKMSLMKGDSVVNSFCQLKCAIEFFKNFMTENNIECFKVKYYDSDAQDINWLGMYKIGDFFVNGFARCGFSDNFAYPFDVLIKKE